MAISDEFVGGLGIGVSPIGGLDDGFDFLAELLVRDADDGDIGDFGVVDEDIFGLLGVDIDPAGDNHMGAAIGEVEEAVFIDPANVAER